MSMIGKVFGPTGASYFYIGQQIRQGIVEAMSGGSRAINIAQNTDFTPGQRNTALAEMIPILGDLSKGFREFSEALSGMTEQMRQTQQMMAIQIPLEAIQRGAAFETAGLRRDSAAATARSHAINALRPVQIGHFDRNTTAGELAYQEAVGMAPHIAARDVAHAEATAARSRVASSQSALDENAAAIARAEGRRDAFIRSSPRVTSASSSGDNGGLAGYFLPGSTAGIRAAQGRGASQGNTIDNLSEQRRGEEELLDLQRQRKQLINETKQATIDAGETESRYRQQNIAILQQETQQLENRYRNISSSASRLGRMQPIDRAIGMAAFRRARALGIENLTPQEQSAVSSIAPDFAEQQFRRVGEASGEFSQLQGAGEITGGTVAGIQEQLRQNTNQLSAMILENQQQTNTVIAAAMRDSVEGLAAAIIKIVDETRRKFDTNQALIRAKVPG